MAEIIGAISAGMGIATFAVQVGKGIKNVQKAINYNRNHATVDLESLESDMKNLHKVIEDLRGSQYNDLPIIKSSIANCQYAYTGLEPDLERLAQAFKNDRSTKGPLRSLKRRLTLNAEESVRRMREKVTQILGSLTCVSILAKQFETIEAIQTGLVSPVVADSIPAIEPRPTLSLNSSAAESPSPDNRVVTRRRTAHPRQVETCFHKQTSYTCGRFWWLELTSTPGFWHRCSSRCPPRCEWNAKLRLALTWLNIPFAVTASFGFASENRQYELRPALSIQYVVDNTSPGFLALWLCRIHVLGVEESMQRLRDLYRTDRHFKYHVNPEGKGYLRHLVSSPWDNQDLQFELLKFFVTEFGMDFSSEEPSLLIECSKWIGEGRHLHLLDTVLEHGFAPNGIDAPAADQWPQPCSPDWISELRTPDPFFLEYFASIVSYEPRFTGVTELQRRILTDTFDALLDADGDLPNKEELFSTTNFLGQSSLHLEVHNIHTVKKLVELGHDMNAMDRWGTTPLMYAAAMGLEDVTIYLLQQGALAKPGLQEARFGRTFLDFAITRGHWGLIHKALSTIQDIAPQEIHQVFAEHVVSVAMRSHLSVVDRDTRRQNIPLVIQQCGDVNTTFGDRQYSVTGNNLMHSVWSIEEAEALVARGFNLFNTPNSAGRLPIHSLTFDTPLIKFCVEHGTDIDHVDANGQTLLFILFSRLGGFSLEGRHILRQIRCCLDLGADPGHSDGCKCPCSPKGCSSSAFFETNFERKWVTSSTDMFWIFEWQSTLQDFHGDEAVKDFLLSLIRRIEFDELGMTHVCCHEGFGMPLEAVAAWIRTSWPKKLHNEDLCEILEEEDEFNDILDQTMRELATKTVSELQGYLLEVLKKRHGRHLQKNAEKRAKTLWQTSKEDSGVEQWHVDYKRDTYWQQSLSASSFPPSDYSIVGRLASYIVYVDLESSLIHDPVSQRFQKDGWYSRRICWVKEIAEVFGVPVGNVFECIDDAIASARLEMDGRVGQRIKDRFIAFFQAGTATAT